MAVDPDDQPCPCGYCCACPDCREAAEDAAGSCWTGTHADATAGTVAESGGIADGNGNGAVDLWAIHVIGPDDILAAESLEAAHVWAADLNRFFEADYARDSGPFRFRMRADVVPWPWSVEGHAAELVRLAAMRAEEAATLRADRTGGAEDA